MPIAETTITIDGNIYAVLRGAGREAVDSLFAITVNLTSDASGTTFVGKNFTLEISDDLKIHGLVVASEVESREGTSQVVLTLGPAMFPLTLGRDSRVFQNLSAVDIVKQVLTAAGVAASDTAWALKGTPVVRPYTVQRGEPDWDFVERLLREEGIHYFFVYGDDAAVLHFTDDSTSATSAGKLFYRMSEGVRVAEGTAWASALTSRATLANDSVVVRDRDPQKPALALEGKAGSAASLPFYDFPGRFLAPGDGKTRATTILDSLRASREMLRGAATRDVRAGQLFEITDHPTDARNGKYFCVEVTWTIENDGNTFALSWQAIPAATPWRPAWREAASEPRGPESVTVTAASGQEIDIDATGAFVFQTPWDRVGKKDEKSSVRTRAAQSALAESMMLPRKDFTMLLSHHDGDVDRPFGHAKLTDGARPPPYKLPDNMTRTAWQTLTSPADGTSSEVRFEDKSGSEEIFWNAAKDMTVTVGDNAAWTIGNDDTLQITGDRKVTIKADEKLTVSSDQSTTISGAETIEVDGNRSLTINGKETTTVSGDRKEKVSSDHTRDVAGNAKLTVGDAMTTKGKAGIKREVMKKLTQKSTGAWTTQTDQNLTVTVMGDGSDTVNGASTESGKKGVQTLVGGDLKETISAGVTISAQGGFGESAKGKLTIQTSAAFSATAATVEISADSEITIVCGATTISIKSDGVEMKSAMVSAAGATILHDGATVKHNP